MDTTSNYDDAVIDLFESKISRLESLVYGSTQQQDKSSALIESLLAANNMLSAAANSRKNIESVYKRIGELNQDLTDDALGDPNSEFERKLNIVLTLNEKYRRNAAVLEKVNSLHASLDKGNLKFLDELRPQLAEIVDRYTVLKKLMDQTETNEELHTVWHDVVMEITKSLVATNNAITDLELLHQAKN